MVSLLLAPLLLFASAAWGGPAVKNPCTDPLLPKRAAFLYERIAHFRKGEIPLTPEQSASLAEIEETADRTCRKSSAEIGASETDLDQSLARVDDRSDKKSIIEKVKALYALRAKTELALFQLYGRAAQIVTGKGPDSPPAE